MTRSENVQPAPLLVSVAALNALRAEMAIVLVRLNVQPPRLPIIANLTAGVVRTPDEIRKAFADQVAAAVRWMETLRDLATDGITRLLRSAPAVCWRV